MSLYPNILDISAFNTMLAQPQHQQTQTSHLPPSPTKTTHTPHPGHQITPYHVSEAVLDFFSHMFAPASYQSCTCSTPCWTPASPSTDAYVVASGHDEKLKIVVDDDIVVLEDEDDGGPLCREATIASWKAGGKKERRNSSRRRSLQWLAGVIGREA
ncbi:hypothetical protein AA0119_g6238 [Alternaria tenuissima]|uniref:Uncharacterized protein n=1 Tax=Alternaria tenuissima TaxID=119927 RepID=A0ABY0G973_9PLEO|nr:hypothetical protein AA0119_g6238 [Alternaria tenuissima]